MFKLTRSFETGLLDHDHISTIIYFGTFYGPSRKKFTDITKMLTWNILIFALKSKLGKLSNSTYNEFEMAFCSVLSKHEPIKVVMLRHNSNSFMAKI